MLQLHTRVYDLLWRLNDFLELYLNPILIFLLTNVIETENKEGIPFSVPFYGFNDSRTNINLDVMSGG